MKVLLHHIYEYKKGLRNLVLHTLHSSFRKEAETILAKQNICYLIRKVTPNKINIFFGAVDCIEILKCFGNKSLEKFTPEEDFILGSMLGYNQLNQCRRFLTRHENQRKRNTIPA